MSDLVDLVWVELDQTRNFVVRIFRSTLSSYDATGPTDIIPYETAVKAIRHAIFLRSEGFCELCATPITETTAHMHELQHRGQGGEISLNNSVMACPKCHQYEHKDRRVRFRKKPLDI